MTYFVPFYAPLSIFYTTIKFYKKKNNTFLFHVLFYFIAQIRKLGDEPLRQVLSSLGGWPVITKNWTIPDFSWETLLGRLRREYNEGILIEEWVGPDDKNSSVNIIQVRTK